MQIASFGLALTSSACSAIAVWFVWWWWLPMLRKGSHQWIDGLLTRLGEVGFDDLKIRKWLFVAEALLAVGIVIGYWVYMGFILTSVVILIYFHLRVLVLRDVIDRRERLLRSQTLSLTVGLHGLTQSGLSLPQAILQLAGQTPAPLGRQIQRVASNYRLGRPLNEAITEVRSQLRLDAFSLLVTSLTCALKQGTPLSKTLMGVQEALEHRDQAERLLSAKTASARTNILILALAPLFFLVLFACFMPGSLALMFENSSGKIVLAAIIGLLYAGIAWARSLLRIR